MFIQRRYGRRSFIFIPRLNTQQHLMNFPELTQNQNDILESSPNMSIMYSLLEEYHANHGILWKPETCFLIAANADRNGIQVNLNTTSDEFVEGLSSLRTKFY